MEFIQQWYCRNFCPIFGLTNLIEIDHTEIRRDEKKNLNCGNVIAEIREEREQKKKVKLWQSHCQNRGERREKILIMAISLLK